MIIASKVKKIEESQTMMITNKALELKENGKNILTLSAGEPDFITPKNIRKAAINSIKKGKTKYTPSDGIVELKQAIKKKYSVEKKLEYQLNQIMVSTGAKQVIFNAFTSSLNKNDEILLPAPYWVSYTEIAKLCEAKVKILKTKIENDFKLDSKELEKSINENTKWFILNSPCNPTGSIYSKEELKEISKVLLKYPKVHILSDDIYEQISFRKEKVCSILEVEKKLKNRTLLVNGVSKAYAMTGWRIGFCVGPKNLINSMKVIQSHSTSNPTSISQYASIVALEGNQKYQKKFTKIFKKRRNYICKLLTKIEGLYFIKPKGSFYVFVSISNFINKKRHNDTIIKNDNDFCLSLLEENGVALVPGTAFGFKNYVRISFSVDKKIIKEACKNINEFCKSF